MEEHLQLDSSVGELVVAAVGVLVEELEEVGHSSSDQIRR